MAKRASADTRWLEMHGDQWRVTVAVPRGLHKRLGTRLKQSLGTDSLALANRLKPAVVARLRGVIDAARDRHAERRDGLMREAAAVARVYTQTTSEEGWHDLDAAIREREDELIGVEIDLRRDPDTGEEVPIFDPAREELARQYGDVARARATPIALHHELYLSKSVVQARTKADDVRAIRYLADWCVREGLAPTLETVTRRVAVRFMDAFGSLSGGLDPATQNKYLNRLSRYWSFMELREYVEIDVWKGLSVQAPKKNHKEEERSFTDDEVRRLLVGDAPVKLRDVMMVGALSGARLDAIVDLKVGDTIDGCFTFKAQKRESGPRDVPIHPDLAEIVARRTQGKAPGDDLFPEWPAPRKAGSKRERSFKTSNAFTAYRRSVGVDQTVAGKRRALVNFHSFRRWFITKAERADQKDTIIAAVVGHKRSGITLGRYSEGPEMRQARRCVAAVKLPPLTDTTVKEQRAVRSRS